MQLVAFDPATAEMLKATPAGTESLKVKGPLEVRVRFLSTAPVSNPMVTVCPLGNPATVPQNPDWSWLHALAWLVASDTEFCPVPPLAPPQPAKIAHTTTEGRIEMIRRADMPTPALQFFVIALF